MSFSMGVGYLMSVVAIIKTPFKFRMLSAFIDLILTHSRFSNVSGMFENY